MKNRPVGSDLHVTATAIECYIDQKIIGQSDSQVTCMEGMMLEFLADKSRDDITIHEVMEHFHIVKSTASLTLSGLEKKGMISMRIDELDHRKKVIAITEKGKLINEEMQERFRKMNRIIEKDFSQEEIDWFHQYLKRIRYNLGLDY